MGFLTELQILNMGISKVGKNVKISEKASIINPEMLSIGDNSRIDDFCVIAGKVKIGRNVHIPVFSNVNGSKVGVEFDDFSGLSYGCNVFCNCDDYSGQTMTNPTIPAKFKNLKEEKVFLKKHVLIGAGSVVMPGVTLAEGTVIGALSMITHSTDEWAIYAGVPARKIKERKRGLLHLEKEYLKQYP